jgi:hypothetical protein
VFKWLSNNYQWLFSGLGVVIIGVLYNLYRIKRKPKMRGAIESPGQIIEVEALPVSQPAASSKTRPVEGSMITPATIIDSIDNTAFLQRPGMISGFVNIRVNWNGTLSHAKNLERGFVELMIRAGESPKKVTVICEVDPSLYPGLALLRPQHRIGVEGIIDNFLSDDLIVLRDPIIHFSLE